MAKRTKQEVEKAIININYTQMNVIGDAMFKCINNDWGTVAFDIRRSALEDTSVQFGDKELYFNGIYFLIGSVDGIEQIYVGQAKKRNAGDSIIARLREHADIRAKSHEKYFDIWKRAIVITDKSDSWGPTELNMIEHIMESEIPAENNQNGNHPNAGSDDFDRYDEKIRQIELYLASLRVKTFMGADEAEQLQTTYVPNNEKVTVKDLSPL